MTTHPAHTLARTNDPATSKAAAEKQPKRAIVIRAAVLRLIAEEGPLTHDQIIARYGRRTAAGFPGYPLASGSSIRTRTAELVDDEKVEAHPTDYGKSAMGNKAHLWRAASVQGTETPVQAEAVSA